MTLEKLYEINDYVMKNLVIPWPNTIYISKEQLRQKFPTVKKNRTGKVAFREF